MRIFFYEDLPDTWETNISAFTFFIIFVSNINPCFWDKDEDNGHLLL